MKAHIFDDDGYVGTISILYPNPEYQFPVGSATTRITIYRTYDVCGEPAYYANKGIQKYITGWLFKTR